MKVAAKAVGLLAMSLWIASGAVAATTPAKPGAKPSAATAPKAVAKPKPAPAIDGTLIARPNGFLSLKLVDNRFVLSFYDANHTPVEPDVPRAALRWNVRYQPNPERTVLNRGEGGNVLTSAKVVRPPHSFKVFLSLLPADESGAAENYAVDFSG